MDIPIMDTSAITRKWLDIEYTPEAPHPSRRLDIYLPETGDGPFPTIICIHGGAFTMGSKNDEQVAGFVDGVAYGFAVVSVEQRLCTLLESGEWLPEGQFPYPLFDYKAAIRFLRVNAGKYNLDPDRFAVAGDSAGGWHAIMAAATANVPALYDDTLGYKGVDESVNACVDWFGCGDLIVNADFSRNGPPTVVMPDGREIPRVIFEDNFLGVECIKHPNLARFASPETWITTDMPPVLLQHGAEDVVVTPESSRLVYKRIVEVCGPERVDYDEIPFFSHGDPGFYSDTNLARVFTWLHEKLG